MVDKNILVDHPTAKKLTKGLTRFLIETCMQRKKKQTKPQIQYVICYLATAQTPHNHIVIRNGNGNMILRSKLS